MYLFLEDLPPINIMSIKGNQEVTRIITHSKKEYSFSTIEINGIAVVNDGISIRFRLPEYAKTVYRETFAICTQPIPNKHSSFPPFSERV
jgi:hypothetical protein